MFAILKTYGKQYKVAKEEKLLIEKIDGNIGMKLFLTTS